MKKVINRGLRKVIFNRFLEIGIASLIPKNTTELAEKAEAGTIDVTYSLTHIPSQGCEYSWARLEKGQKGEPDQTKKGGRRKRGFKNRCKKKSGQTAEQPKVGTAGSADVLDDLPSFLDSAPTSLRTKRALDVPQPNTAWYEAWKERKLHQEQKKWQQQATGLLANNAENVLDAFVPVAKVAQKKKGSFLSFFGSYIMFAASVPCLSEEGAPPLIALLVWCCGVGFLQLELAAEFCRLNHPGERVLLIEFPEKLLAAAVALL
jgi:hypothetical protein